VPVWALLVVALAVFRVAAALMLYLAGWAAPLSRPLAPLWVYASLSTAFVVIGLALVVSQRRDSRAAALGALLVLVGCPLVRPLIAGEGHGAVEWLEFLRPEAFTPAVAWLFASSFPKPLHGRAAAAVNGIIAACVAAGVGLFLLSLAAVAGPAGPKRLATSLIDVPPDRGSPMWLFIVALGGTSLAVLAVRSFRAEQAQRRSGRLFIAALCAGLSPITVVVLAEGIWPALGDWIHRPPVESWVTAALFAALATLPFTTAYAVLFDRVVDVRIVLHAAAQYVLARYVLALLTLVPFGGLLLYLLRHREQSLASLLTEGERPIILLASGLMGVMTMQLRPRLVRALDRRYHRLPYDGGRVLARLTHLPDAVTSAELAERVQQEIRHALHAPVDVFLLDEGTDVLRSTSNELPVIGRLSPLVRAARDAATIDLDSAAGKSLLSSLPRHETEWLSLRDIRLLTAIHSPAMGPVGLLAAGPKASGLSYSTEDRVLISAAAAAVGLATDSLRLRHAHGAPAQPAARECEACGTVYPPDARMCCDRRLIEAGVPYVLRGVFRLERRVGSGGCGIVYRAADLALGRTVAIKLVSRATANVEELIREARHMARLSDPHLAAIHGVERWRDNPLLVQEFLDGGTLSQRLLAGSLSNAEVAELGRVLAGVLDKLHAQGVVHCDVKPSNVGFAGDGAVKLFDFSLARHLPRGMSEHERVASDDERGGTRGHDSLVQLAGTPAYMCPEAIRGRPPHPMFDWWGLSVVLYEALARRRPFEGEDTAGILSAVLLRKAPSLREYRPELPIEVIEFFDAAFDPEAAGRPQRGAAFDQMLHRLLVTPDR
jgi:hypothetical protein